MNKKTKPFALALASFSSALLGAIGLSGWCCTVMGAAVFGFLGIGSLSSFLVYNNRWFLLAAGLFLILAAGSYIQYKNHKSCPKK